MNFSMLFNRKVIFGAGSIAKLNHEIPGLLEGRMRGGGILLVISRSVSRSDKYLEFRESLCKGGSDSPETETGPRVDCAGEEIVSGEPSPETVDRITARYSDKKIDLVVGIGGGSVMDAGKAVSAMLPLVGGAEAKGEAVSGAEGEAVRGTAVKGSSAGGAAGGAGHGVTSGISVRDYLEGVGRQKPPGIKIPYVAIPTTSGTGSEATKNAVITERGRNGFKKSLRHDSYVPEMAIIDPEFMLSCPRNVTAASGMDTVSQLLESYISTKANPLTEALALEGLKLASQSLPRLCNDSPGDMELRGKMALASYISGITLANAGLGTVHGIAGPLGGIFDIPHGVACANLLPGVLETTIEKLKAEAPESPLLVKLGSLGFLFARGREVSIEASETIKGRYEVFKGLRLLVESLEEWLDSLGIPPLSSFGISIADVDIIAEKSGNKNNPISLSREEIALVIKKRL